MNQSKSVEKALFPAFLPPSASGSLADGACSCMALCFREATNHQHS
ncbi:hypothetical protein GTCCBUS3UF5_33920 [Geobacillus thermoleovorans CCB_US3_UF5]|uniref:Uncharacterized protein n=2 Tax=Geobacillus TaxID=129337 RepID=A0A1Q5SYH6_9BACL|nr:hypothetical protein GTCCBUS3UF5_33920 [Geobacillus thermoleovorans CCB_US3_UF5]OKO93002.1 hypothetical protein BRO54_2166 [Geobacillus proteiniphilus]